MLVDFFNSIFELAGGIFMTLNCWTLYRDKELKGISVIAVIFFASWAAWKLFFYTNQGFTISLIASLLLFVSNGVWAALAIHYKVKNNGNS